jgi:hypothetical protein
MAHVTVHPEVFTLVHYDHARLVEIAAAVADRTGFPADRELVVDVQEATPLQRLTVRSLDPVTLAVEGGAFEDPKRPRRLHDGITEAVLATTLLRVMDRLGGGFNDAPPDDALTHAQRSAWTVYAGGRAARAGFEVQQQRQRYAFRNRHAFSDAADAVFDRLWRAEGLTWAALDEASATAAGSSRSSRMD